MIELLNKGEIEVAVALTEGLIANAVKTGPDCSFRLAGTYVSSPLTWAVSVKPTLEVEDKMAWFLEEDRRVGVSRMGSGSQIIPFTVANKPAFEFVICGNIGGLVKSVQEGDSDAFLWEKFTSRPYQSEGSGELKWLMDIKPEWPAFLFAVRKDVDQGPINTMLDSLGEISASFHAEQNYDIVASEFKLDRGDVKEWWEYVSYPTDHQILQVEGLKKCIEVLIESGVVGKEEDVMTLIDRLK
jgi:hypothetical protein